MLIYNISISLQYLSRWFRLVDSDHEEYDLLITTDLKGTTNMHEYFLFETPWWSL